MSYGVIGLGSRDVNGECIRDTEEACVVFGIITEFKFWYYGVRGGGVIVGGGFGVDVVVSFCMM